jgi:DNA polymerase-4
MDAFYASVEQRDDPSLRGRPVIVGGPARRGVVCAASYEARPFGVRSAMSMGEALRLCPDAAVVPPRHSHYASVSARVFGIFARVTPLIEGLSLDEAFLDVTGSESLFGDGETIARKIKREIWEELSLRASAGVAPNKFTAKLASDLDKPDGLLVVPAARVRAFLAVLPIERMWGVGARTAPHAHEAGIHTIGDLADADDARLAHVFGERGPFMGALARGEDDRPVVPDREAKSIGAENTFEQDVTSRTALTRHLLEQSVRVASRMHVAELATTTVVLKLKFHDFKLITRSIKLPSPVRDTDAIYAAAIALLDRVELRGKRIRLTGVSATGLVPKTSTRTLFPDEKRQRSERLEDVAATLRARFGDDAIVRARLLDAKRREP